MNPRADAGVSKSDSARSDPKTNDAGVNDEVNECDISLQMLEPVFFFRSSPKAISISNDAYFYM